MCGFEILIVKVLCLEGFGDFAQHQLFDLVSQELGQVVQLLVDSVYVLVDCAFQETVGDLQLRLPSRLILALEVLLLVLRMHPDLLFDQHGQLLLPEQFFLVCQ